MSFPLESQVVVVTGGAGRIGRAFCTAIARMGGTAVVSDTAEIAASGLAVELCSMYGPQAAVAVPFDITQGAQIGRALEQLQGRFGRIDALVNNAYPRNARYGAKFEDVIYADFCENISLHLGGYFLTAQRFARYFAAQHRGSIINIGSIYGVVAPRFEVYEGTPMTMPVEYAVIKAGVLHLTRYLAQYLKPQGIRVNAISPGGVFAGQPEGFVAKYSAHAGGHRMLDADDLTGTLIYLLSSASAHVTGQNIIVDDGWSL
jgi:NAD(P)-dependent dehydrogenase (short-subunit alcohol dehydrogenase family)